MKTFQRASIAFLSLLPFSVFAVSAGELSTMITSLLGEVSVIANVIAFMTGGAFCISALIKFQEYRRSPQNIPISRPITELFVGIILFALPFLLSISVDNALY